LQRFRVLHYCEYEVGDSSQGLRERWIC
jgi:hypothetical protein